MFCEDISEKDLIVYHGTPEEHTFNNTGKYDGTFFSKDLWESKSYGEYLYKVHLRKDLNIFDTLDMGDCEKMMNEFDELYDDYYSEDEDEHWIRTADQIYNNSDNWLPIEETDGVLSWLGGNYDGVWVTEGGVRNVLLFYPVKEKLEHIFNI